MPRKRKGPALPKERLAQVREPIHIDRTGVYTTAALKQLLRLSDSTIAYLKKTGRLHAASISNTDLFTGEAVLDCLRRCAEEPQAIQESGPAESSAA